MIWFLLGMLVGVILGSFNSRLEKNSPTTQDIIVGWKK